jgi:hypothetical protein
VQHHIDALFLICCPVLCCTLSLPCRAVLCPAGELQEPSKRNIARMIEAQDQLVEQEKEGMGDGDAGP